MKILIKIMLACLVIVGISITSSCEKEAASQTWVITFANCPIGTCGTNVTVLKGGAISQKGSAIQVVSLGGTCRYPAPISGQWSGTIFKFTMNGGGCSGEQIQGFTQGDSEGEYGKATKARGKITWTFNNSTPVTDTWTAILLN